MVGRAYKNICPCLMEAGEKECGPHMKLVSKEIVHRLLFNIVIPQLHTLLPGSLQCRDACLEGLVFALQLMYSKRSLEKNAYNQT